MTPPARGLVVTYHAITAGPPPLHVDPELFERHLDALVDAKVTALTVSDLAASLRAGALPDRAVAITFDDGFAHIAAHAAPALARHGMTATVFVVSDHVGGSSDWATQPVSAPRLPLLDAVALRELASHGWEVGSHGRTHRPLAMLGAADLDDELRGSRVALEEVLGVPVRTLAYPYGSLPADAAAAVGAAGYDAACTTRPSHVTAGANPGALPRVDAHYLRNPRRLRAAATGHAVTYLAARRLAARARRRLVSDHRSAA